MWIPLALLFAGGPPAYPQPQVEVGRELRSLRSADLDADGRPELVCVDAASDELVVLRAPERAPASPPVRYPTGQRPLLVRLADVDGDGAVDALVAWRGAAREAGDRPGGGLSLHTGDGRGGFTEPVQRALGFVPTALELADANGDGLPDAILLGAAPYAERVTCVLGRGDGSFGPEVHSPLGSAAASFAGGQLDDDGALDLAVCTARDGVEEVRLLAGDAAGAWSPFGRLRLASAVDVAVADVDRDGRDDVVAATGRPTSFGVVATFRSLGGGRFAAPEVTHGGFGVPRIELVDLDEDGRLDVLTVAIPDFGTAPRAGGLYVNWGRADGSFSSFDEVRAYGQAPLSVAAAAFDERPGLDVAFARAAGDAAIDAALRSSVGVVHQLSPRRFEGPRSIQPGNVVGAAVRSADFDRDGLDDVAVLGDHFLTSAVSLCVRRGLVGGGLGPPRVFDLPGAAFAGPAEHRLGTGDFDGDGFPDVVVSAPGGARVLRGGASHATAELLASRAVHVLPRCVDDWDGDGAQEFGERRFAGASGFGLAFHGVRGGEVVELAFLPGLDARSPSGGDVDGDGRADLVYAPRNEDALAVRRGGGDFSFGPPTLLPLPGAAEHGADVGTADLDGDGRAEVFAVVRGSDELTLFRSVAGAFEPPRRHALGRGASTPQAADLDGDGRLEVLVANRLGANLTILPGHANGTLGPARAIGATFQLHDLAVRDTGDGGPPDILFADGAFHLFGALRARRP